MKKSKITGLLLAVVAGTALFASCGSDDSSSNSAPEITKVWARTSPMETSLGAVYMTISSKDGDELTDVSVDSSIAAMAQIHEMVMASAETDVSMPMTTEAMSGEMVMQEVDSIVIDAGGSVDLMPGGYHIMLMEIAAPLELGAKFDVTLTFAKAGKVTVTAEVRDEAP
jgi:copper(I)-binding protein